MNDAQKLGLRLEMRYNKGGLPISRNFINVILKNINSFNFFLF